MLLISPFHDEYLFYRPNGISIYLIKMPKAASRSCFTAREEGRQLYYLK